MKRIALLPAIGAMALTLACSNPSNEAPAAVGTAGAVASVGDRAFIEQTIDANMAEVELGRLAQERASGPEVKQFAAMMVRDHSKGLENWTALANRQGIPAPAQLPEKYRDLKERLSTHQGAEFDREYMKAMVDGHEDVVDLLQRRVNEDRFGDNKGAVTPEKANDAVEATINEMAATTLPTTRHHLDEARRINAMVEKH